jgi:phosphatidylglycerophosphate synthase
MSLDFFKKKVSGKYFIPTGLTVLRIVAAPLFFYTFLNGYHLLNLLVFIFAIFTDFLDGYIARKMGATSNVGAYLDVIADFILVGTCFLAFVIQGWYDPLIMGLILLIFFLFVATSGLKKPVYDPVGKYTGSYLMGMILLSLLFSEPLLRQILWVVLVLFSSVSIITRIIFFLRRNDN